MARRPFSTRKARAPVEDCFIAVGDADPQFEWIAIPDGHRLVVRWCTPGGEQVGDAKLDFFEGALHISRLVLSERYQGQGVTRALVDRLGAHEQARGVQYATLSPRDEQAARIFQATGAERVSDSRMAYRISGRRRSYSAWRHGELAEPEWHAEIRAEV